MDKGLGAESQRGKVSAFYLVTRVYRCWTLCTATTKDVALSRMAAKSDSDQISMCTTALMLLTDVNVCNEALSECNPITHTQKQCLLMARGASMPEKENQITKLTLTKLCLIDSGSTSTFLLALKPKHLSRKIRAEDVFHVLSKESSTGTLQ